MYQEPKRSNGFTLVELMLAMSFIAILLISIAMLSIYLTTLYDRGSTMKDINQAGTEIASDIKRSIAAAPDTYPQMRTRNIPEGGKLHVICAGSVSYVINDGEALYVDNDLLTPPPNPVRYFGTSVAARIAKVDDSSGILCSGSLNARFPGRQIPNNMNARELLSQEASHTLSVWNVIFNSFPTALQPELTTVTVTIGTSQLSDLTRDPLTGSYVCNTGNGSEWCGINTFEIVGRSGNGTEL